METEKCSITLNTIVSEVFKWIGFVWTGLYIFFSAQLLLSFSESTPRLEAFMRIYEYALEWAIVAVPAFVASYFGKK